MGWVGVGGFSQRNNNCPMEKMMVDENAAKSSSNGASNITCVKIKSACKAVRTDRVSTPNLGMLLKWAPPGI
jgi:hypothetical protein